MAEDTTAYRWGKALIGMDDMAADIVNNTALDDEKRVRVEDLANILAMGEEAETTQALIHRLKEKHGLDLEVEADDVCTPLKSKKGIDGKMQGESGAPSPILLPQEYLQARNKPQPSDEKEQKLEEELTQSKQLIDELRKLCTLLSLSIPKQQQQQQQPLQQANHTEIQGLRRQLELSEQELRALQVNLSVSNRGTRPLTPQMMPDAKSTQSTSSPKLYHKLGLDQIDKQNPIKTANTLKNVLMQLNCPLDDTLPAQMQSCRRRLNEHAQLKSFVQDLHQVLYHGSTMTAARGKSTAACLEQMLEHAAELKAIQEDLDRVSF